MWARPLLCAASHADSLDRAGTFYFDGWEDVDVEERVKNATELIEQLRDADVVFGFDGWEQSGCAAPVNVLLVLSPAHKKVWAVELEPCSES